MEVKNYVTARSPGWFRKPDRTMMILCNQQDLIDLATAKKEKLVDVVSPGLFGLNQNVVSVPESWAREMTRRTHVNPMNLVSMAGVLNFGTLYFQWKAFKMSSGDIQKKGGYDQIDAFGSLLGAASGMAGGAMEIASLFLTPGALNRMGTPFAAELAAKVPAHLWLKFGSGLCLAAGAVFDSSVAFAKSFKAHGQGDADAAKAYLASGVAEFAGGLSLGGGAFFAYRAAQLDRLGQLAARQAVVRIFSAAFSPLMLARCLTGVGLLLWLGGLGFSFLAMYLEDDDNEVFLRRSYFGKGHSELGRFQDFDHEVQSFGSLSMGTRAEMEWHDKWKSEDTLTVTIKVLKPDPSTVVTVRLQGYDGINGKLLRDLTAGKLRPLKPSEEENDKAAGICVTGLDDFVLPEEVSAVKLSYYVYPNADKGTQAIATGDLWIND